VTTGDPYAPWWTHNIVMFDVETTGLGEDDRVIEVGLVRFERGEVVDQWGSLIYPQCEVPEEATAIHGITTLDVLGYPPFIGSIPAVSRITRDAWPAAFNASFDRRMWVNELRRLRIDAPAQIPMFDPNIRWLDPLVWVRQIDGLWAKNKLTVACDRWGVQLENAHRATDDAIAAGKLLFKVKERLRDWTMTEMLRRQHDYDAAQDKKRGEWFRKKGIPYR